MVDIFKNKGKYTVFIALASVMLSTTTASGLDYRATVIAPEATIRQEHSIDSQELDKLNIGDEIAVKELLDNWYRVELSNRSEGWISSEEVVINDISYKQSNLKKGEVITDVLNVRVGPSTENNTITQIHSGNTVTIVNTLDEWYEVILNNGIKGWVHSNYIKITYNFPRGKMNHDGILLRRDPGNSRNVIDILGVNDLVYIKNYENDWYNIITSEDKEGWVESNYVTLLLTEKTNVSRSGLTRNVFESIGPITEKYLGKKYVYGASGPNNFDCSGFSYYILKTYYGDYLKLKGINQLPRRASEQARIGTTVSKNELVKGDLVFFNTDRNIGKNITHVGIYLENGQFIHASSSKKQIMKSSLSEGYYKSRFIKAVRL